VVAKPEPAKGLPDPPIYIEARPAVAAVEVRFNVVEASGGQQVTGYRALCTSSDGGVSGTNCGSGSPITVSSLSAKTYRCRVTATNTYGTGPPSALSKPVVVLAS
jgi:hypothetical protein